MPVGPRVASTRAGPYDSLVEAYDDLLARHDIQHLLCEDPPKLDILKTVHISSLRPGSLPLEPHLYSKNLVELMSLQPDAGLLVENTREMSFCDEMLLGSYFI